MVSTHVIPPTSVSAGSMSSSSSRIAAIAGGVAGGLVCLGSIVLLFWLCVRKRKRNDPDRDIATSPTRDPTLRHLDTDEVTTHAAPYGHPDTTQMEAPQNLAYGMAEQLDGESSGLLLAGATVLPSRPDRTQATPSLNSLDNFRNISRSQPNALGSTPSPKEREVAIERSGIYRAHERHDRIRGSALDITQHQDGGRVSLDYIQDEPQREIPPSYHDCIGPDHDPHHLVASFLP
jgi:hypothetical protein